MKTIVFALVASCLPCLLMAQDDASIKYASEIKGSDLKKYLTVIAAADMEGRETGTVGQRKAASYIQQQFMNIGLAAPGKPGGYQQAYPLFKDSVVNCSLKIGSKEYYFGRNFIIAPASAKNGRTRAKKIVFVGYGISDQNYDDYKNKDVTGKIVVFCSGEPRENGNYLVSGTSKSSAWSYPGTSKKAALAKRNGAVAAFVINPAMENISPEIASAFRKSNLYFPREVALADEKVNYATIMFDVAKDIFGDSVVATILSRLKAGGPLTDVKAEAKLKVNFSYEKKRLPFSSSNVIGILEGSDKKDEYVFLTAHYDHLGTQGGKIYYGADDDGSGTASVIEMAQIFAKAKADGHGPRRTIVFMTVSGEEKGLWGSEYYSDHPLYPLGKTSADLNTDMVGRVDTERKTGDSLNYIYVIGHDKLSTDLPVINEGVNQKLSRLTLDYKFDDPNDEERIYYRSDHYNFAKKGVPILFFYDGMLKADYHKPTDTIEKINFELMEKRVQLIFLTAWEIANRNDMLKRDIPLPP